MEVGITLSSEAKKIGYPRYETSGSSGMDLGYCGSGETILVGETKLLKTGVFLEIPEGFEGQIRSRSGLSLKHGLTVLNSPGTIDSDYRGEIGVIMCNLGNKPFEVENGMRIAQIVFCQAQKVNFIEKEILSETIRSFGGFGHTGIK